MPLEDAEMQRRLEQLTERAWNHSRPTPREDEFSEMTPLFRERLCAFTFAVLALSGPPADRNGGPGDAV